MNPSLKQQLKAWKKKHQGSKKKKNTAEREKNIVKNREHLKERELKELMGMYQPIYKRGKGGAFRQR